MNRVVYSQDKKDFCDQCKKLKADCVCAKKTEAVVSRNFYAIFRIEKGGRGGKIVTVIDGLPKNEIFLKDLTKELKSKCGSGGTFSLAGKEGLIEIQGDQRIAIKKIFDQKKIKYKGH